MWCHVTSCDAMWHHVMPCDIMWCCDTMWCHVTSCDVDTMWCHVTPCDIMWCYVTPCDICDIMWHHVMSCDIMWCYVTPCDVMWHHVMPCDIMWCHATPCDVMWHHVTCWAVSLRRFLGQPWDAVANQIVDKHEKCLRGESLVALNPHCHSAKHFLNNSWHTQSWPCFKNLEQERNYDDSQRTSTCT